MLTGKYLFLEFEDYHMLKWVPVCPFAQQSTVSRNDSLKCSLRLNTLYNVRDCQCSLGSTFTNMSEISAYVNNYYIPWYNGDVIMHQHPKLPAQLMFISQKGRKLYIFFNFKEGTMCIITNICCELGKLHVLPNIIASGKICRLFSPTCLSQTRVIDIWYYFV